MITKLFTKLNRMGVFYIYWQDLLGSTLVKPVLRGHLWDKETVGTGLIRQVTS